MELGSAWREAPGPVVRARRPFAAPDDGRGGALLAPCGPPLLRGEGACDAFPVFDGEAVLARRLTALPPVPPLLVPLWEEILALDPPADLARRLRASMDRAAGVHQH